MGNQPELSGPDLQQGVAAADLKEGKPLLGHADGQPVLLTRIDGACHAVGAVCTHYSGPLAEGLVVDGTVRCPWHHACFSLKTGEVLRTPALNDLPTWRVEESDGKVTVHQHAAPRVQSRRIPPREPKSVGIVGAGAAGQAAAETLRREGYGGPITMFDSVPTEPVDRPNLSKDYLAGTAQADWIPLRGADWYDEKHVEVVRGEVAALDARKRSLTMRDGKTRDFEAVILATGAEPIRLTLEGKGPPVLYLRTLADSDAIIEAATSGARRVVVLGASFIGLEVAASLRARGLEVHVAAPEARPLERVMGPELGDFIKSVHEEKGVVFHLGRLAKALDTGHVVLDDGSRVAADFVVAGVGVRPRVQLAEAAGLEMDKGVAVDERLMTSAPNVYAAGDIARWPDAHTGANIRVEHWVLAERHGQAVARNVLGENQPFDQVPFFWSAHYDVIINYVGHAEQWDRIVTDGSAADRNYIARYVSGGKELAVASIFRDRESLEAELRMERVG
jgi:NADPH-dependent 2,4-dienoyl-CoA reductase/sulfur reductase-like enzyme/nitrite reductase/ring-hydroxylating ferredoxin subunit